MKTTRLIACALAVATLVACGGSLTKDAGSAPIVTPSTPAPRAVAPANHRTDRTVEIDLRNALTAEKVNYVDGLAYSASPATMKQIEPTLDWGNAMKVRVADVQSPGDHGVVCLTEMSASGVSFALADVAVGPHAGTFYGRAGCPTPLTALTASKLTTSGWS